MTGYSRFHIFKEAPTKNQFLADSPVRLLEAGNLNILLLPGASIRHLYDYILPAGRFEIIILFIGGNDIFDGFEPSSKTPQKVAQDLIELADFACQRTRSSVFVLGIPERDKNRERAIVTNDIVKAGAGRISPRFKQKVEWKYRSFSNFTSGRRYFKLDKIHLNNDGLNNVKNLVKEKVLYSKYKKNERRRKQESSQLQNKQLPL